VRPSPGDPHEGAVIERLRRDADVPWTRLSSTPDSSMTNGVEGALGALYRQYLDIGRAADLPMIICTPTCARIQLACGRRASMDGT